MRKKLTIFGFLGVGFVAVSTWFCYGSWPGTGGLSASDVLGIRRAVGQETAEPILKISGESGGTTATVETGRRGDGLGGIGHEYYLNQTARGWQIVTRNVWMSMQPDTGLFARAI